MKKIAVAVGLIGATLASIAMGSLFGCTGGPGPISGQTGPGGDDVASASSPNGPDPASAGSVADGQACSLSLVTAEADESSGFVVSSSGGGPSCPAGLYCKFAPASGCGSHDGVCTRRADVATCKSDGTPVCGCDRRSYDNDCLAAAAGISVQSAGKCASCTPDAIVFCRCADKKEGTKKCTADGTAFSPCGPCT